MADVSDVGASLAAFIAGVLYPEGTDGVGTLDAALFATVGAGQSEADPDAPAEGVGAGVKIVHGWPNKGDLDAYLAAGKAQVSVTSTPQSRNTTRHIDEDYEGTINPYTYTVAVAGQTVTIGGAAPTPYHVQNLGIVAGGEAYTYQAQAGDTPNVIAAALRALVPGASGSGADIILPDNLEAARRGTSGSGLRAVRYQTETFLVSIWARSPTVRDAIARVIDPPLADEVFLTLADASYGRMEFVSSNVIDNEELQGIFRRDLRYTIDYATFVNDLLYEVITAEIVVENEHDQELARIVE